IRFPPPVAVEVAWAISNSCTDPLPMNAAIADPVSVVEAEPWAVLGPKSRPLLPAKLRTPAKAVALRVPALLDRLVARWTFGPERVSVPDTVAVMVDGEEVLVFSTRMSLVIEPLLIIWTETRSPSAGSNCPTERRAL